MKLNLSQLDEILRLRLLRSASQLGIVEDSNAICLLAKKADRSYVEKGNGNVTVYYSKAYEFFYGVKTFLSDTTKERIDIACEFNEFGIMVDCSRNGVLSVEGVKRFLDNMALMGYNQLQLYTEDTYEIKGEPYWGYMRGKYTCEELKELDAYARAYDIELVPCIQTLAHVNQVFRWKRFQRIRDIDDILLAGCEETYELIDKMFETIKNTFSSKKIHIGMDEAHNVGRGKYRDVNGAVPGSEVMVKHLNKVTEMALKHGLEPMMWSDMFFRLAYNGVYRVDKDAPGIDPKIAALVPQGLRLVYWDYYRDTQEPYEDMIDRHGVFKNNEIVFAGGAWNWRGWAPFNKFTDVATENAFNACIKKGIKNVFLTMWGDDGQECTPFALLSGLCFASDLAYGETNHEKSFIALSGMSKEDFITLDLVNDIKTKNKPHAYNVSKIALFNDPLAGIYDYLLKEEEAEEYKSITATLNKAKSAAGRYTYIFDTIEKLSWVLEVKYALGLKTRRLYKAGDKKGLKKLAKTDYVQCVKRLEKFYACFEKQWMNDNKPYGFDVQDARIGGLILRIKHCKQIIEDYVKGKIFSIPELEEELLDPISEEQLGPRDVEVNKYMDLFSCNVMSHCVNYV